MLQSLEFLGKKRKKETARKKKVIFDLPRFEVQNCNALAFPHGL
jgi:hypothetical protein